MRIVGELKRGTRISHGQVAPDQRASRILRRRIEHQGLLTQAKALRRAALYEDTDLAQPRQAGWYCGSSLSASTSRAIAPSRSLRS